jgi:hypothetical protein
VKIFVTREALSNDLGADSLTIVGDELPIGFVSQSQMRKGGYSQGVRDT